jgi:hypothetical protein
VTFQENMKTLPVGIAVFAPVARAKTAHKGPLPQP